MKKNKAQSDSVVRSEASHTPTPWNVQTAIKEFVPIEQGGGLKVRVFDASGKRVASMNVGGNLEDAKANAAFIVRAVNSHEALLEAAKRVRSVLNDEGKEILTKREMEDLLFQAIAQAEGK